MDDGSGEDWSNAAQQRRPLSGIVFLPVYLPARGEGARSSRRMAPGWGTGKTLEGRDGESGTRKCHPVTTRGLGLGAGDEMRRSTEAESQSGRCEWPTRLDDGRCYKASSVGVSLQRHCSETKARPDPMPHGRCCNVSCCAHVGGAKLNQPELLQPVCCCWRAPFACLPVSQTVSIWGEGIRTRPRTWATRGVFSLATNHSPAVKHLGPQQAQVRKLRGSGSKARLTLPSFSSLALASVFPVRPLLSPGSSLDTDMLGTGCALPSPPTPSITRRTNLRGRISPHPDQKGHKKSSKKAPNSYGRTDCGCGTGRRGPQGEQKKLAGIPGRR